MIENELGNGERIKTAAGNSSFTQRQPRFLNLHLFPQSTLLVRVAVIELRFSGSKLAQVLGLPSLQGGSLHELWGQPGLTRQPGASKPPATLSMPHACALLSTYIQKAL